MTEASPRSLIKGVAISLTAAAAHHVTLIFGVVLFAGPVLWTAYLDARDERVAGSIAGVFSRAVVFGVLVAAGVGIVLSALLAGPHSTSHSPDSHSARQPRQFPAQFHYAVNYFVIPYGSFDSGSAFIVIRGASFSRWSPCCSASGSLLFLASAVPQPLPRWLLGRAYEVLTFDASPSGHADGDALGRSPRRGASRSLPVESRHRSRARVGGDDWHCSVLAQRQSLSALRHYECGARHRLPQTAMATIPFAISPWVLEVNWQRFPPIRMPAAWMATTTQPAFCPR